MSNNIKLNPNQIFRTISYIDHYDSNLLTLDQDNTLLTITKEFKFEETIVKNEWQFESNKFYCNSEIELMLKEEIINTRYFFNFQKNFRGTLFLLTDSKESFLNLDSEIYSFTKGVMNEIYNECFGLNLQLTLSYVHINNSKYVDYFNFDDIANKEFKSIVFHKKEENDTCIKEVKEIAVTNIDQFITLLSNLSNCLKNKKRIEGKFQSKFTHEIFTLRMYDKNKNFFSKFNLVLFKAYKLNTNNPDNNINNTKENSLLFNGLMRNNYRDSKLTNYLIDTATHNCLLINILSAKEENIIILHDILTLIKPRKSNIKLDFDEDVLKKQFDSLKITDCSNKESKKSQIFKSNDELFSFIQDDKENREHTINNSISKSLLSNASSCKFSLKTNSQPREELNMERLKKIVNKSNLRVIFDTLENS